MVFRFLAGVLSLGAAGALDIRDGRKRDKENAEFQKYAHSYPTQLDYDWSPSRVFVKYNYDKVVEEILADYPKMPQFWQYKVATAAATKRLFETENPQYKYRIPKDILDIDIDISKYATDATKNPDAWEDMEG